MQICPRCQKSRRFIQVGKVVKKKHWIITRCGKCAYNISTEEWKTYEDDIAEKTKEFKRPPRNSNGEWIL